MIKQHLKKQQNMINQFLLLIKLLLNYKLLKVTQ